MTMLDWPHLVAAGVIGAAVLLLGLRGRRVDALPRCRKRRCRYDLTSFLGETRPGRAYPITCPECGRVAGGERAVRWGRRRARRWVVGIGALLLALTGAVGGVEVYARTRNVNTIIWLPLFVLLDRAAKDTPANGYAHQVELLRRVDMGEIDASGAGRVVRRILVWQRDASVEWGLLGTVFAALAEKGVVPEADVREFWDNILLITTRVREEVEEGDPIPIEVAVELRVPWQPWWHPRPHQSITRPLYLRPGELQELPDFMSVYIGVSTSPKLDAIHDGKVVPLMRPARPASALSHGYTPKSALGPTERHITMSRPLGATGGASVGDASFLLTGAAGEDINFTLRGKFAVCSPYTMQPHTILVSEGLRPEWEYEATHRVRFVPRGHYAKVLGAASNAGRMRAAGIVECFLRPEIQDHMTPAQIAARWNDPSSPKEGSLEFDGLAPKSGLAVEAFLRLGDEEIALGRYALRGQEPGSSIPVLPLVVDRILASPHTPYLVLRCDDMTVRNSVALHAWDGEIVLEIKAIDLSQMGIPVP